MLARYLATARCLSVSVCHKCEFCRNSWMNRAAGFWHGSFLLPILMKCDRMFILKLRERTSLRNFFPDSGLWLKLRSFDLLWICCTTCPYRVVRQLTRFRLIYRVARSVCGSRASCSLMSQSVASFLTRMLHQVWCRYGAIFGRLFTGCSVFCWPTAPSYRLVIIPLS